MSKRFAVASALLSTLLCISCTSGQFSPVTQKTRGFMVPLQRREQPGWRRHLLRSGAFSVYGSVRELGYFYAALELGTPPRTFSLIIDTGSTITYVPCKGCQHCGTHKAEWFDPDQSPTAKRLDCNDKLCNCGRPSCSCEENNKCYYRRSYAEGSSSEGYLVSDVLRFPDAQQPVHLVFGCINSETGELYRQIADGLVGMGNNDNAIQSQLVRAGVIEDVFSLCFGEPQNGVMLLGDVALPSGARTVYTPLSTSLHLHYYNVRMEGITVAGERLPLDQSSFDRGYGVVLDSGTTFTYLPTVAFEAMSKVVADFAQAHGLEPTPGADPQYHDICWKGAPDHFQGLEKHFPVAEFIFGDGAVLTLPPVRYLFRSRPGEYCLSFFDNGSSGTLIGTGSVLNVVVTYDRRNGRMGFTDMSCQHLAEELSSRSGGGGSDTNSVVEISSPPPSPAPPSPPPANLPTASSDANEGASAESALPSPSPLPRVRPPRNQKHNHTHNKHHSKKPRRQAAAQFRRQERS